MQVFVSTLVPIWVLKLFTNFYRNKIVFNIYITFENLGKFGFCDPWWSCQNKIKTWQNIGSGENLKAEYYSALHFISYRSRLVMILGFRFMIKLGPG